MWQSLWNWFYGKQNGATEDMGLKISPALIAALGDKDEVVRLNAAYALGTIGAPAVPALIEIWREASRSGVEHREFPTCDLCVECNRGTGGARIDRCTTG